MRSSFSGGIATDELATVALAIGPRGAWTTGAIACGWLLTVASVAFGGGHPPSWFVVGEGAILATFVLAPIGAGAAVVSLWQAHRAGDRPMRRPLALLAANLLFLLVAAGLRAWILWTAAPRMT